MPITVDTRPALTFKREKVTSWKFLFMETKVLKTPGPLSLKFINSVYTFSAEASCTMVMRVVTESLHE